MHIYDSDYYKYHICTLSHSGRIIIIIIIIIITIIMSFCVDIVLFVDWCHSCYRHCQPLSVTTFQKGESIPLLYTTMFEIK